MANQKPRLRRLAERPKPLSDDEQLASLWTFVRHGLDPVAFAREALEFFPDSHQEQVLTADKKRVILLMARQRGKTDCVALRALHRATFWANSMIIIVSASEKQTKEVVRKINAHRRKLNLHVKMLEENKQTLELPNRSRIVALPASAGTVRGYSSVDLLIEDEAGEVPDDLHETVKPMLQVSDGTMFILGTPKGPKGHFSEIWHQGDDAIWDKIKSTAWDNPRVSKQWLENERRHCERVGKALWFQQEYECAFIATGAGLVYPYDQDRNYTARMATHEGWQFVLAIDYGFIDSTAFVVVGWRKNDPVVYVIESAKVEKKTPSEIADLTKKYTMRYAFARVIGDLGGLGKGYAEETRRRYRIPIEAADKNNKRGYLDLFSGDLRGGLIKVFPGNERLLAEWSALPWNDDRSFPADGYDDHLADACLYAWRASYGFLEETRQQAPDPGSPEALAAEAEEMFSRRLAEVSRPREDDLFGTSISDIGGAWALS